MNFPLGYESGFLVLVGGFLFGFFLESAGLGSPRKLNTQFSFRDWTVFSVMSTAIVVAAIGLWLLDSSALLPTSSIKVHTPYYYAMALGGALLGAGLTIGGYCPGTSVTGLFSGRLDGLFFMFGLVLGSLLFGFVYPWIKPLFLTARGPARFSLAQLFGLPGWVVLLTLVIFAVLGFCLGSRFETRANGPLSATQLSKSDQVDTRAPQN